MDELSLDQEENLQIRISLISNRGVTGSQLTKIISTIEKTCFIQELETILPLLLLENKEYENIAWRVMKQWEFDRPPIFVIKNAKTGSIIFEGMIIAATTWILLNTLGETFKEAWKVSELHNKLKSALLTGRKENAKEISEKIKFDLFDLQKSEQRVIDSVDIGLIDGESLISIKIQVVDKITRLEKLEYPDQEAEQLLEAIKRHGT